jgi:non-specific serine/threonine protein kinase
MLETIRQYGIDRLREAGEETQRRGAHLTYFVAVGKQFSEAMEGPKQESWLAQIASERDNVRAALAWSVQSSPIEGLRLARAFSMFWRIRGHFAEGLECLRRLLDAVPIDHRTAERAGGLYSAAALTALQGDLAEGKRLFQESLAIFREIKDQHRIARGLCALAWVCVEQGDYLEAEALARESAASAQALGDRRLLFSSLENLAIALHRRGEWAAAREWYEHALSVAREHGTPWEIGDALNDIGRAECDEGRHDLALKRFAEGMTILHGLENRPDVFESLEGLANVAAATAAPRRAARLWGAADGLRQEIGNARSGHESIAYERQVKAVRAILTAEAFDQAWDEGRAMSLDDAVRYALDSPTGHDD